MPLFILDTDHVTLLQRGHPQVVKKVQETPEEYIGTSIVTYEEQLRGRLTVIRQARSSVQLSSAYLRLREMQEFFCTIRLVDFDARTAEIYSDLRKLHREIGTMDLRIAATVLSNQGTLVTRNIRDFSLIQDLSLVDWSIS